MLILAELNFAQTVTAGFLNALFTAGLVGISAVLVVKSFEKRWEEQRQVRQLEYQTRTALRETYAQLLVAQRRSRQASLRLANAGGAAANRELEADAVSRHDEFIDLYHRLNLDASKQMWEEVRGLRDVLDHMLVSAQEGNKGECEDLAELARDARQNLERSFRDRLGYEPLQERRPLGDYDKQSSSSKNEDRDE